MLMTGYYRTYAHLANKLAITKRFKAKHGRIGTGIYLLEDIDAAKSLPKPHDVDDIDIALIEIELSVRRSEMLDLRKRSQREMYHERCNSLVKKLGKDFYKYFSSREDLKRSAIRMLCDENRAKMVIDSSCLRSFGMPAVEFCILDDSVITSCISV